MDADAVRAMAMNAALSWAANDARINSGNNLIALADKIAKFITDGTVPS